MKNKISTILTIYNTSETSKQILTELVFQKKNYYPETEIIVVNDCSTEDMSFINEFIDDIVYINLEENYGCAGARNIGLDSATGKYVVFIDGDDSIKREYLHIAYRAARKNNHYSFVKWDLNGKTINPKFDFENHPTEVQKALWGYIFNRELLNMGHFNEMVNVDSEVEYLQNLLTKDMTYAVTERVIYDYNTLNENSLTRRFNRGEITKEKIIPTPSEKIELPKPKVVNSKPKTKKTRKKR